MVMPRYSSTASTWGRWRLGPLVLLLLMTFPFTKPTSVTKPKGLAIALGKASKNQQSLISSEVASNQAAIDMFESWSQQLGAGGLKVGDLKGAVASVISAISRQQKADGAAMEAMEQMSSVTPTPSAAAGYRTRDFDCDEHRHRSVVLANESGIADIPAARKASVLRVFGALSRIFRRYGIVWWLQGGSLLGAVRNEGFIEWDLDGDIGMEWHSFEKLRKHAHEIAKDFLELDAMYLDVYPRGCFGDPGPRKWLPARVWDGRTGFYVDVFAFQSSGLGSLVNMDMSVAYNFTASRDVVFPLEPCRFDQLNLSCPAKPEQYLDSLFGGRWNWYIPDHAEGWSENLKAVLGYIEGLQAGHPTTAAELERIQKLILEI